MGLHRDAANEGFSRSTNLFSIGAITVCGFFNFDSFTISAAPMALRLDASNFYNVSVNTSGGLFTQLRIGGTDTTTTTITLSTGTWYFIASTRSSAGTTLVTYVRAVGGSGALSSQSATPGSGSFTPTALRFGVQGIASTIRSAGARIWSAELTAEQLERESRQYLPNRLANINGIHPLIGSTLTECYRDFGPNNAVLSTDSVAPTIVEGPPVPWRVFKRQRIVPYTVGGAPATGIPTLVGPRYGLAGRRGLAA